MSNHHKKTYEISSSADKPLYEYDAWLASDLIVSRAGGSKVLKENMHFHSTSINQRSIVYMTDNNGYKS